MLFLLLMPHTEYSCPYDRPVASAKCVVCRGFARLEGIGVNKSGACGPNKLPDNFHEQGDSNIDPPIPIILSRGTSTMLP